MEFWLHALVRSFRESVGGRPRKRWLREWLGRRGAYLVTTGLTWWFLRSSVATDVVEWTAELLAFAKAAGIVFLVVWFWNLLHVPEKVLREERERNAKKEDELRQDKDTAVAQAQSLQQRIEDIEAAQPSFTFTPR